MNWLCASTNQAIPFSELRDQIFEGKDEPIINLIAHRILSFDTTNSIAVQDTTAARSDTLKQIETHMWFVVPATPSLALSFVNLKTSKSWQSRMLKFADFDQKELNLTEYRQQQRELGHKERMLNKRKHGLQKSLSLTHSLQTNKSNHKRVGRIQKWHNKLMDQLEDILQQEHDIHLQHKLVLKRIEGLEEEKEKYKFEKLEKIVNSLKSTLESRLKDRGTKEGKRRRKTLLNRIPCNSSWCFFLIPIFTEFIAFTDRYTTIGECLFVLSNYLLMADE